MKCTLQLLFIALVALACNARSVQVTVNVFSGTPNPSWTLDAADSAEFTRNLLQRASMSSHVHDWRRMGYSGFDVATDDSKLHVYGNEFLEMWLLISGLKAEAIKPAVAEHIKHEIYRPKSDFVELQPPMMQISDQACKAPVIGPDNATVYDVRNDDCGFFVSHESENNCYDYGTNVATNTFAQPGRGSGHHWQENTCDSIRQAAESDGLVWNGTVLPSHEPGNGHFVALMIWPNTNFHWIRLDSNTNGRWSHKPGQTPVRNTDNNGKLITDPAKADFSPWTQFCGYMQVIPSAVCNAHSCIN
eukprot:TRINITY_DN6525_c0_g1_i1.p1 TRINITY_DN6525_c0_g1~~TRINITY_DN6525_c0_g1_i1.p1  ORF type:complete len:303 (-),score=52.06 TRINITY_DN6525_c0_g1_i1:31-939(-)